MAPASSPDARLCQKPPPPSTATTANGGSPALTACARPCSTPPAITVAASLPLPCSAITGRSGLVWPGGRAMAQLVLTPPRAADTKEPVTMVGAGADGGSRGALGAGANGI